MKTLLIKILGWLIYQANSLGKDERFYKIKNLILDKYGRFVKYDIQFIEGKRCYLCGGMGYQCIPYVGVEDCYHCYGTGWYKLPVWNVLAVIQLDKYSFHKPYQKAYSKPENSIEIINGYIEHPPAKYSHFAKNVLFFVYEKGYLKRFFIENGNGWRAYWWLPKNWLYNAMHLIKYGKNAIPFRKKPKYEPTSYPIDPYANDDLPF